MKYIDLQGEDTTYEDKACEILKDVEFKDAKAIAKAVLHLAEYLMNEEQSRQAAVSGALPLPKDRIMNGGLIVCRRCDCCPCSCVA